MATAIWIRLRSKRPTFAVVVFVFGTFATSRGVRVVNRILLLSALFAFNRVHSGFAVWVD